MPKTDEKTFSLAARYKDLIAEGKNRHTAQKNAPQKQQSEETRETGKCFEVFGMLLAFFLFATTPAFASDLSSVPVGARVEFMRYECAEMKHDGNPATNMVTDTKGRNIMIIL